MNSDLIFGAIWGCIGIVFLLAMLSLLRIWSIARDARRIADALEGGSFHFPQERVNGTNRVRDFLE